MSRWFRLLVVVLTGIVLDGTATSAQSEDGSPLQLEAKIPLGHVRGRIDYMPVDLKRRGWAFILPNLVIVASLGALYVCLGDPSRSRPSSTASAPAVITLILHSCYRGSMFRHTPADGEMKVSVKGKGDLDQSEE